MDPARESAWQAAWAKESLGAARRVPGREKFFAIVAYPGASGFLHLGHLRGMAIADELHRYHRMMGHATFFPTGTHASGLPAVTFAQKVADRDPSVLAQLEQNGVPEADRAGLADPATAARYLGRSYLQVFRELGILLDERAYVTTIDDDYARFIGWQFRRLHAAGVLGQAPHFASVCPVCGPVSVDPSETDLSSGGEAEWIEYTVVPFALDDGRTLLAATLRPETVYGVTNLWLHPHDALVVWHHGESVYLVSRAGAERLVDQHGGRIGHDVPVGDLLGRRVTVPLAHRSVPLLASPIVDPSVGTGVVMSVPAHAPADWLALAALGPAERSTVGDPLVLVEIPEDAPLSPSEKELLAGPGVPAERAVRAVHAASLADGDALAEATDRLYRLELVRGRMRADLVGGRPVAAARPVVAAELASTGHPLQLFAFSEPVVCRNGHAVVIRRVPDQWFIRYSDPEWKAKTRAAVAAMAFFPPDYGAELPGILDWFADRPCTRRGRWLGTPFPYDPSWTIEPIADSTFYPAYFVVRPFVADGRVPLAALTDAFFDFVFRGTGPGEPSLAAAVQREVREEFTYWYPLDLNIGGKEHKRVHFPVFLYTHTLLLPPELRPRGVFVNWWLTFTGGEKISKRHIGSKGGAIPPIRASLERWGADALRLFYAEAASPHQDIEWDPALVDAARDRIAEIERLAGEMGREGAGGPPELERWLLAEFREVVAGAHAGFQSGAMRDAAQWVYARTPALLRRYVVRGGGPGPAVHGLVRAWIRLLSPITPHVAEELGVGRFDALVAVQPMPRPEEFPLDATARAAESYLERIEDDLRSVLRPALERGERPQAVTFFVAAPWKAEVEQMVRDALATGDATRVLPTVMARVRTVPAVAAFRGAIPDYVTRVSKEIRSEPAEGRPRLPEADLLRSAEGYLVRRFGFESVQVVPEAEAEAHDPMRRRERARPGRPAFYLHGGAAPRPAAAPPG
jgi:leucyl-tRNA synthetase